MTIHAIVLIMLRKIIRFRGVIVILYPLLTWPVSAGNMSAFSVNTVYAKKQIKYGSQSVGHIISSVSYNLQGIGSYEKECQQVTEKNQVNFRYKYSIKNEIRKRVYEVFWKSMNLNNIKMAINPE